VDHLVKPVDIGVRLAGFQLPAPGISDGLRAVCRTAWMMISASVAS
jgi:hypothetical protein